MTEPVAGTVFPGAKATSIVQAALGVTLVDCRVELGTQVVPTRTNGVPLTAVAPRVTAWGLLLVTVIVLVADCVPTGAVNVRLGGVRVSAGSIPVPSTGISWTLFCVGASVLNRSSADL